MEIKSKLKNKLFIILYLFILSFLSNNAQSLSGNEINTSSLQALNVINVTIGGDFPVPGTYPASRTERVDQLLTRILTQYRAELFRSTQDEELLALIQRGTNDYAKRNIKLKRISGEEIIIDLIKFRLTGNFKQNPYLQNDDILIFPPLDLERNFVHITGAVNKELKFEFVEGDRLSDAIFIAQGINEAFADVEKASISRLSEDGSNENIGIYRLDENPLLLRGDRIRVLSKENKKHDYSVLVKGEVKNPGRVFITKNSTTISDVIEKAGGITDNASLKFSELIRDLDSYYSIRKKILEDDLTTANLSGESNNFFKNIHELEYLRLFRAADLVVGDTLFFGIDNRLRALTGFSQLDFRNLEDSLSYESKYIVADGDIIVIPQKPKDVYVWGGVRRIGTYGFNKNYSVRDYIKLAGGFTDIAYGDEEIYLIKGKTNDWLNIFEYENLSVEAGDYIYVKKEVPRSFGFYLGRVAAYAGIIGSIATVILLLTQIGK